MGLTDRGSGASRTGEPRSGASRTRTGFGVAAAGVAVVAAAAVVFLALGTWRRFVRTTAPALLGWPGAPWVVGAALGLLTVIGATYLLRFTAPTSAPASPSTSDSGATPSKPVVGIAAAASAVAAFGPLMYVLAALPGRNCPAYRQGCEHIDGTWSALAAYVISAVALAALLRRRHTTRAEARRAEERERLRRLRKRGGCKSRAAHRS
ncbi:hypothetical protein [Streptomyces sp. NPDC048419]|uniref:hypothetical protein n=1 Tax=Streptomyces sp. NPDC048419 TaxID=3365547 RepID=UPI00371EAEA6